MSDNHLPVCLALLRVSRGWNQEDLARAAGVRAASISTYERGKLVPSLKMLHRLTGAMGYPLSALEEAQSFLLALEAQSAVRRASERLLRAAPQPAELESGEEARRQQEIELASIEAGRVATRLTRLFFTLVESHLGEGAGGGGEEEAP